MNTRRLSVSLLLAAIAGGSAVAPVHAQDTRMLRHPTVSRDLVAFAYAGDLWVVGRNGGDARRLTATPGVETEPNFSPDGSRIAFSATHAGNTDVYVVPAAGGAPERLTYHPGVDRVRGWTPDGTAIVFGSARTSAPHQSYFKLWSISVDGGLPEQLPMPRAFSGTYSPDGERFAYEEISTAMMADWHEVSFWRHYRGGRTHPILIMDLDDYSTEALPWTNSNDSDPMWVGNTVYFLSDRNHTVNLFSWSPANGQLTQLTRHDDFDIMNAAAGPDAVVYEQAGYIWLIDAAGGEARRLPIDVNGDLPWARPHFENVAGMISAAALSPTGARTAFEARGDIYTVPTEKGDFRNLTQSSGAHDRSPVWSPDGTRIAWLSDASGEYQLMVGDPLGLADARTIELPAPIFYFDPRWSPDGEHILLHDNHLNLWLLEVESGDATKIDTETFHDPSRDFDPTWSPDSRWVAYSKSIDNQMRAIFVYSVDDGSAHQITDGMSDAVSPAFDASGKYLYFLASTNYGPSTSWLEMSSIDRPVSRAIYLAVLDASEPSPLLPESDEAGVVAQAGNGAESGTGSGTGSGSGGDTESGTGSRSGTGTGAASDVVVDIDFDGILQRIIALGIPEGEYGSLEAGTAGTIYYTEPLPRAGGGPPALRLQRYELSTRSASPYLEGIRSYTLSGDRTKLLYQAPGDRWGVVATERPAKVGDGAIDVAQLQTRIDPRAEWAQIFDEMWRIQRDFFYDPQMHGADWEAVYDKYSPLVQHVGHRSDLGYLIAVTAGELTVGHSYLQGEGDVPDDETVRVGLLGADFTVEDGHYRISRIYTGENWNPELRAPLSAPGIQVDEGDYLLEVNGNPLAPPANPYRAFEGTAGRQTTIRVNSRPTHEGSRIVTVVPIASEAGLRARAWIENNRRRVDELSDGRLAYVWLPNTAGAGYTSFTRYFYAQQDKRGAIIDERYNQGGMVADYIVNELDRQLMGFFARRSGRILTSPMAGLYGPKVMVVNESAGSGGDALPYYFKQRGIGPIVGTRTWGGLVGTLGVPSAVDGGGITAPDLAFYDMNGRWAVENEGVMPDIVVENTAAAVIAGRDPQLERAVQEALRMLEENPVVRVPRPAPIDRVSPERP